MSARTLLMAAATAGPPGASLNLSFMSGSLDPRVTFTRASTATYFDATGTLQTAAANAPRWDYDPVTHVLRGMLVEEGRTNVLLNSATLGTQGVAVTAQAYTLSFYGTGTVTMSGAFAGSLVGTGAFPARVQTTFTPAAGTLTCTVTGSVLNAQLEAGGFVTSWIPTSGATGSRFNETATMSSSGWVSLSASTLMAETIHLAAAAASSHQILAILDDGGATNRAMLYRVAATNNVQVLLYGGGTLSYAPTIGALVPGAIAKVAASYRSGQQLAAINGVTAGADVQTTVPVAATRLQFGSDAGGSVLNGYIRRVRYWPRMLSNAELQSATR